MSDFRGGPSEIVALPRALLANGMAVALRPVGPADREQLVLLFGRLSPRSRHRRYLSPKRELSPRELDYLSDVDHLHHEVIAAVNPRDGSIVGTARYVEHRRRPGVADMAVEVADEFQNVRLGTVLARTTIGLARANGFTLLTATTLWENAAARALLRKLGFRTRASHGAEIELELRLWPLQAELSDDDVPECCGAPVSTRR